MTSIPTNESNLVHACAAMNFRYAAKKMLPVGPKLDKYLQLEKAAMGEYISETEATHKAWADAETARSMDSRNKDKIAARDAAFDALQAVKEPAIIKYRLALADALWIANDE